MNPIQSIADKGAIGLSVACTLHCLALPFLTVLLPATMALKLGDEAFHFWMAVAVLPTSIIALWMGCKKHNNYRVLLFGGMGLSLLIAAVFLGHDTLGEVGEKWLTVLGATLIATGHLLNHRLCRRMNCECHS